METINLKTSTPFSSVISSSALGNHDGRHERLLVGFSRCHHVRVFAVPAIQVPDPLFLPLLFPFLNLPVEGPAHILPTPTRAEPLR